MPEEKKRRWYVAGLLSLLMSGLGQIYNGQGKKGVILMALMLGLSLAVTQSSLLNTFAGLVLGSSAILAVYGYALLDAIIGSRRIQSIRLNRYTRWYVYPCIFLLHALIIPPLLERNKAVDTYVIKSSAMSDSLLAGDYVATAARDYTPAFQDVVIFKHPADTSLHFVMRLVGLPGDTIMVKNKSVRRNGVELAEPYVLHVDPYTIPVVCEAPPQGESPGCPCRDNIAAFTVPPDRYFVMGDNRDASKDSRCFGFVPEENILGKALYVYFSKEPETNSIRFGRLGMLME